MDTERLSAPLARSGRSAPDSTTDQGEPMRRGVLPPASRPGLGHHHVTTRPAAPTRHTSAPTRPAEALTPKAARRDRSRLGLKGTMVLVDVVAAAIGMAVALATYQYVADTHLAYGIPIAMASLAIWPAMFAQQGLYQARYLTRRIEELRRLVNGVLLGTVGLAGTAVVLQVSMSRGWLLVVAPCVFVVVAIEREVTRTVVRRLRESGRMERKVLLVGDNSEADELIEMLQVSKELGYRVVGRVSNETPVEQLRLVGDRPTVPHLGSTEDILDIVRSSGASSVVVATTGISLDNANRLVRDLTREGIYVELSSSMRDIATRRVTLRPLGRYPVMSVEPIRSTGWRPASKRVFDVAAASLGLIAVSPILLLAAAAIRITSGPGVLFRQTRVGRNGVPFTVYKLRTMVPNAEDLLPELLEKNEASGPMFKMSDDPRVTKVGRFLRKASIDELPQLINVVLGDMSLVGPRPALPHEAVQWNDDLKERLRVKPGITGNWQVSGRFTSSLEDYQRLDLYYVDNWSLVSDLVILIKTLPAVLKRDGAA